VIISIMAAAVRLLPLLRLQFWQWLDLRTFALVANEIAIPTVSFNMVRPLERSRTHMFLATNEISEEMK